MISLDRRIRNRIAVLEAQNKTALAKLADRKRARRKLRTTMEKRRGYLEAYWDAPPRSSDKEKAAAGWRESVRAKRNLEALPSERDTMREVEYRERLRDALVEMIDWLDGELPELSDESCELAIEEIEDIVSIEKRNASMGSVTDRLNIALFGMSKAEAKRLAAARKREANRLRKEADELIKQLKG